MEEANFENRSVYIADNLDLLRALNSETIDLVCIDPPFAKKQTFGQKEGEKDPLKPPLTESEGKTELDLMARWGIQTREDADKTGINWPGTVYRDFWSWEKDIHEEWMEDIKNEHPAVHALIETTRLVHSDDTPEIRRWHLPKKADTIARTHRHCEENL